MVVLFQQDFNRNQTGVLADIQEDLTSWHDGGDQPPGWTHNRRSRSPPAIPFRFDRAAQPPADADNPSSDTDDESG